MVEQVRIQRRQHVCRVRRGSAVAALGGKALANGIEQMAGRDLRGEPGLAIGVQKLNLPDLLEVHAHGIVGEDRWLQASHVEAVVGAFQVVGVQVVDIQVAGVQVGH